jgi:hypothetical protein
VNDIIRQHCKDKLYTVEVHAAGGYPLVSQVTANHNLDPAIQSKAIAIIDGDAPVIGDIPKDVYTLPGEVPETVVWSYVTSNAENLVGLIQQRCQIPQAKQDDIILAIQAVNIDAGDPHLMFKKLADNLGFLSEIVVRRGFISIYNENKKADLGTVISAIQSLK